MTNRKRFTAAVLAACLLAFIPCRGSQDKPQNSRAIDTQTHTQSQSTLVYVCACLKTKSCSCMTEAKMEGPCACGTQGGPPLKAVPKDSTWAVENREALAK